MSLGGLTDQAIRNAPRLESVEVTKQIGVLASMKGSKQLRGFGARISESGPRYRDLCAEAIRRRRGERCTRYLEMRVSELRLGGDSIALSGNVSEGFGLRHTAGTIRRTSVRNQSFNGQSRS